ncbi:MAG: hypothetical protein R3B48_19510 [Kofleriaceae bacterium]
MTGRAALALGASLALWSAAATAAPITALVPDATDVRQSTLVGRSGQVYEPDAAGSRWVRRAPGGVSIEVTAATLLDGELVAFGARTPLFRRRGPQWLVEQVGQRGRVLVGAGPHFSIAIGRQLFLRKQGRFVRIGAAPADVVALWAGDERSVVFATDQAIFRRRGAAFVQVRSLAGVLGFSGAAPHALTATAAIEVRTGAKLTLPGVAVRAASSAKAPAAIVRLPTGRLALARDLTRPGAPIELPVDVEPAFVATDLQDRAVLAADGAVQVLDGSTWRPATLVDELPAARPGPPPARSP